MKRSDLIKIANDAYNNGGVGTDLIKRSARSRKSEGCTLALFMALEIVQTFSRRSDDEEQLEQAIHVLERGKADLQTVIDALQHKLDSICLPLHRGHFYLEEIDGTFAGFSSGATWNGFAVPLFTKEVADQILAAFNRRLILRHNLPKLATCKGERYSYPTFEGEHGAMDTYEAMQVGTRELYPIGYMAWGWREAVR